MGGPPLPRNLTDQMKREVIRIGDTVRVLRSRLVKRVGYPIVWYDLMEEVEQSERVWQAYCLLQGLSLEGEEKAGLFEIKHPRENMPRYYLKACAMLEVERRDFGGKVRSLHYYPTWPVEGGSTAQYLKGAPDMAGGIYMVDSKRVVKTGKRFHASGGVSHDGEYWGKPGGLEDCKTHVLLGVGGYEIEQCDVELLGVSV